MTGAPALRLTGLSRAFGGLVAVDGVELSVQAGERRALIGPNGAGKTTLFNLISGDLPPSGGRITLFGKDVTNLPPHRRAALGLARTFQITNLFPRLTVLENLLLAVQALERTKLSLLWPVASYARLYERARAILDSVGLADKEGEVVRNLSHGEQRQLEVAMALAGQPRLLLLDEPTAGLSPGESQMMTALLKRLDSGLTLLLIEHDIVSADDITQRKRSPYIVRTGWSSSQPSHPFGKWVYENLKYAKIAMIGYDFAFGWEVAAGFHRTFEEAGGQIVQKLWPPLGNADYGPYLAQLKRDVDAVYAIFSGADALRFTKQYEAAGLKTRLPLVGGGTLTDEHVLRTMGDEVLGIVTALHYSAALNTPANRKFAQAYEAKYKQIPSYYSEGTYVAGMALKAALEATGGDIEDVGKFLAALRKVDLSDAPRGPMRFDEYGNPVQNVYVRKVERAGGRLQNTVIHTFPSVSQFWTYKPEEFLKQPVYSRDYPPCTHC